MGSSRLPKLPTGISGLDEISRGGLPEGGMTLLTGVSGSGKTVLSVQFLAEGIRRYDEGAVFVSFEENPDLIKRNMRSFGWDIAAWESAGRWAFVHSAPDPDEVQLEVGLYDLSALLSRIESAVERVSARRLVIDSVSALFLQLSDRAVLRRELYRIISTLGRRGVTTIMTAYSHPEQETSFFGIEEYTADAVMFLRNSFAEGQRRRSLEIVKYRGAAHHTGQYPLLILPERGAQVLAFTSQPPVQGLDNGRLPSGNSTLDRMTGGGFFRHSVVLISGETGSGKTLLMASSLMGGLQAGERGIIFLFKETREEFLRASHNIGLDFRPYEANGQLEIHFSYPEAATLDEHLYRLTERMRVFKPQRIAVDSLSVLERISVAQGFTNFMVNLIAFLKEQGILGLFVSMTPLFFGERVQSEVRLANLADVLIALRYLEVGSELRRGLTIVKLRGSGHDQRLRELEIGDTGLRIAAPLPLERLSQAIRLFAEGEA